MALFHQGRDDGGVEGAGRAEAMDEEQDGTMGSRTPGVVELLVANVDEWHDGAGSLPVKRCIEALTVSPCRWLCTSVTKMEALSCPMSRHGVVDNYVPVCQCGRVGWLGGWVAGAHQSSDHQTSPATCSDMQ